MKARAVADVRQVDGMMARTSTRDLDQPGRTGASCPAATNGAAWNWGKGAMPRDATAMLVLTM